jgi:iron complex transport system ATP-binding protein
MPPMIHARGLHHRFGARAVLDGVDLDLSPGECLIVLGPNGAGKTTLLRILSGVLAPDRGDVRLGGAPVAALAPREIARRLAVVPQELVVPFPYLVRELVAMGRAPHLGPLGRERSEDRRVVERTLAELGLGDLAERAFPTLSGGEKQRVLLARARAQEAPALLLDEPTAHMDLGHRLRAFEWITAWVAAAADSRAALIVTHDLSLAARFAHRIVLLDRGRIAGEGPPAAVLTPRLIESVYGVEAEVRSDETGAIDVVARRSRIRYHGGADGTDPGAART